MSGTYNPQLVFAAFLVAILASYTALDMAGRVRHTKGSVSRAWLAAGTLAMGLGVWSMHFIGMLAFRLPIPLGYDLAITGYSLLASLAASGYALWLVSRPQLRRRQLATGALLMGLGIATMHYLGMAAMRMDPGIDYDPLWFAASIVIAIAASAAALWITLWLETSQIPRLSMRLLASLLMGLAIVGMHFTGMAAANFPAGSICSAAGNGGIDSHWRALVVIVATVATIGIALIASVYDRHMRQRTGQLSESLADANEKLVQAALHDPLTHLPNRLLLQDRLEQAILKARRNGQLLALMFVDLDGFKEVNDAYGHHLGDHVLRLVAGRIAKAVRAQDTIARLGGDEFIVLAQVDTPEDAAEVAQRICSILAETMPTDEADIAIGASIGVAFYPQDAQDAHGLLASADTAMYHAKQHGRNGYSFFTPTMQAAASDALRLLQDLRRAQQRGELVLHYQPKFAAGAPALVTGAEALLRWNHPERGFLAPDLFIPLAERSRLILPIGQWVLDHACAQLRLWHDAGYPHWSMAVNLSPVQFTDSELPRLVADTLQRHRIPADRLTLEITETTAMKDVDASLAILSALTALGVRISIDDFGTGYSSLLYLKRMPASELKIDRAFVRDLVHGGEDAAIVSSIIALGRTLNLRIVAEGVETREQQAYLSDLGCDSLQGYHLGRPMDAARFLDAAGHGASSARG